MEIKDLKPSGVFNFFERICQIPRPSKHEEQVIAYLQAFGREHGLKTTTDEAGNVLIEKPASKGMEDRQTIVLQSHMDMVPDQRQGVSHDWLKDPVETYVDNGWLKAKGTTLGADNGIGVATELAVLADDTLVHGPIECLFTRDEETGLTGAFELKEGFIHGDILLNLDSEDEGQLFIGCAGGVDSVGHFSYTTTNVPQGYYACRIEVKGLLGGHSGDDINRGRANAIKVLTRLLQQTAATHNMYLCSISGGSLHNAIPSVAQAVIAIEEGGKHDLRVALNLLAAQIQAEYHLTDPGMEVIMDSCDTPAQAIDCDCAKRLLQTLYAMPHGMFCMSQDVPGLVETSTNLATVKMTENNKIVVGTSQRSSTDSSKQDIANMVRTVLEMGGAEVTHGDGYPGWKPNPNSPILETAVASYKRLFGKDPEVKAIHAGLECGLFLSKYPKLDMISFGPTLRGVHTPDERIEIATVDLFWQHLLDILKNAPKRS